MVWTPRPGGRSDGAYAPSMEERDRQRRHDERFQKEVLDGLARILDVLHDISDSASGLARQFEEVLGADPTKEEATASFELYTTKELADLLNVSPGTLYSWRD